MDESRTLSASLRPGPADHAAALFAHGLRRDGGRCWHVSHEPLWQGLSQVEWPMRAGGLEKKSLIIIMVSGVEVEIDIF